MVATKHFVGFLSVLVLGAAAMLIAVFLFVPGPNFDYGVVFDAGSTGTRVHIYIWPHPDNSSLPPDVVEGPFYSQGGDAKWSMNINPGISAFGTNPQGAADSLQPLIQYALSVVPFSKVATTPVFLFATAGMRLLNEANATASDQVLEAVRNAFSQTGFLFTHPQDQVRIITGQEEGLFGYVPPFASAAICSVPNYIIHYSSL